MDKNISTFVSQNSHFLQVLLLIAVVGIIIYFAKCSSEGMENHWLPTGPFHPQNLPMAPLQEVPKQMRVGKNIVHAAPIHESQATVDFSNVSSEIRAEDLLPKSGVASEFSSGPNFVNQVDLNASNFLVSGFAQSLDTQGGTNRNGSLDLRGDVPIPVNMNAFGMNVSTILPNPYARSWEIGGPVKIN